MPIYEYECPKGHTLQDNKTLRVERLESITSPPKRPLYCWWCHEKMRRVMSGFNTEPSGTHSYEPRK